MGKTILFCVMFLFLTACQVGYLWHVSMGQMDLLSKRVSIEKALEKYDFSAEEKSKLKLVSEIKTFARDTLKMDIDEDIYTSYVQLENSYVSHLLQVAPAYELKAYEWDLPVVGRVPYKGFFDKEKAQEEAQKFSQEGYDTYLRGVKAYSTLQWFDDPILSSMLTYSESDFVTMIFHELAHTVLFFKNHINFNERFAEFIGRKSAILFYRQKEGNNSATVKKMQAEWEDELLFSSFIQQEYELLRKWYIKNKGNITPEMKQKKLSSIQELFRVEIQPGLKTRGYDYFAYITLNNARLLPYRAYSYNMEEFETLFNSPGVNGNIKKFIEYCSQFEDEENPERAFSQKAMELEMDGA